MGLAIVSLQFIVEQLRLVNNVSPMSDQVPDLIQELLLICVESPDLLSLGRQFR